MVVIVISGPPGSGKSTVARLVAKELDLPVFSAGALFREIAREMGVSLIELNMIAAKDPRIDMVIDRKMLEIAEAGDCVVEAHLGAWVLNKVADLKVFLTAPLEVRAKRIAKRDGVTFDEALEEILKREYVQWERFKRLYGFDVSDVSSFDLVFNTNIFTPDEIAEVIVRKARNLQPS